MAEQVKSAAALEHGGPYGAGANAHAWLASLPDPDGGGRQERRAVGQGPRRGGGRLRHRQPLCALAWLLARARPTPAEQADTFARFAIFVQGKAWIGARCLDISKVATVLDAPPRIEICK